MANHDIVNDGLTESQRSLIINTLAKFPQIEAAILYGSRAMGRYRDGSDIDLTLKGNIDLHLLNQVSIALDDLLLPYEIDLSIFDLIDSSSLKEHIERIGVVFFSTNIQASSCSN